LPSGGNFAVKRDSEDAIGRDRPLAVSRAGGIAERLRAGQSREAVIAAWGISEDGRKVLLHLMAGPKEDTDTVRAFFQDCARGLGDPLLVVSDGRPGSSALLRRASRGRHLSAACLHTGCVTSPTDLWPEFKARAAARGQARSRAMKNFQRDSACDVLPRGDGCKHLASPPSDRQNPQSPSVSDRIRFNARRKKSPSC
jgi:hypothetical protein